MQVQVRDRHMLNTNAVAVESRDTFVYVLLQVRHPIQLRLETDLLQYHCSRMVHYLLLLQHFPYAVSFAPAAFGEMSTTFDDEDALWNAEDDIAFSKRHLADADLDEEHGHPGQDQRLMLLGVMQPDDRVVRDLKHRKGKGEEEVDDWGYVVA